MIPLRDNLKVKDFPLLTVLLVVVNVVIFFGWQGGSNLDLGKVLLYGNVPYEVSNPGTQCMPSQTTAYAFQCEEEAAQEKRWETEFPPTWVTFFSSMFMHISIGHLIGNMIFLIVFGLALEAGLGRASFLLFYVVGGLGADLGHILFDPSSQVPALGASGAISAVMGGYVMLYPRAKIFTWIIPPLPFLWGWIRASWVVGINLGFQVVLAYFAMAAAYGSGGGTAYFAHFGGFLAGIALVKLVVDDDTVESLRKQARIASGDEQRIVEHIETPPERPMAAQAYPYAAPQQPGVQPGAAVPGQPPGHAAPAYVAAAVAPAAFMPDPFAAPQQPAVVQPAQSQPAPVSAVPPDPFATPAQVASQPVQAQQQLQPHAQQQPRPYGQQQSQPDSPRQSQQQSNRPPQHPTGS